MTRLLQPGLYDRDPAASAEVSVAGWVAAAWLACAIWLCLALLDRDSPYGAATLWASALATAAITGGVLWAAGYGFRALVVRGHRANAARWKPVLRVAVMMMFVLGFMAATGLFICLVEIV